MKNESENVNTKIDIQELLLRQNDEMKNEDDVSFGVGEDVSACSDEIKYEQEEDALALIKEHRSSLKASVYEE